VSKSSDCEAEKVETFVSVNDMGFGFAQRQAAFGQELVRRGITYSVRISRVGAITTKSSANLTRLIPLFCLCVCRRNRLPVQSFTAKQSFHSSSATFANKGDYATLGHPASVSV